MSYRTGVVFSLIAALLVVGVELLMQEPLHATLVGIVAILGLVMLYWEHTHLCRVWQKALKNYNSHAYHSLLYITRCLLREKMQQTIGRRVPFRACFFRLDDSQTAMWMYRVSGDFTPTELEFRFRSGQGVVGKVMATQELQIVDVSKIPDVDLRDKWDLTDEQITETRALKLIIAFPIFWDHNRREIAGVVAIDTTAKIASELSEAELKARLYTDDLKNNLANLEYSFRRLMHRELQLEAAACEGSPPARANWLSLAAWRRTLRSWYMMMKDRIS